MRAILNDIHGNQKALEAVLRDAVKNGADGFYCQAGFVVRESRFELPISGGGTETRMGDEGQSELFKAWLNAHAAAVWKVARAYTLTPEDCQDLAQEILFQVWRSLPQFRGEASNATWCYRVALNTALGWRRQERRRRTRQRPLVGLEALPSPGPESGAELHRRETVERLYSAIRRLPKDTAALVLLYLEDLSYREIADVLGISESNVGVKLSRAKKALAELMNGEADESGR